MIPTSAWSRLRALTPSLLEEQEPLRAWNGTRNVALAGQLQVARNSAERRKGLLGRSALLPGEGLWILPCQAVHTAFMQFPIDLIYLDRTKRVLKVTKQIPAWRASVCLRAHSVLELPVGTIARTETVPGDLIYIMDNHTPSEILRFGKHRRATPANKSRIPGAIAGWPAPSSPLVGLSFAAEMEERT